MAGANSAAESQPRLPLRYSAHVLIPIVSALLVVIHWFISKAILFEGLEYTSDLFSFLQMARSVFEGRPLLFENGFGDHKALHNYYVVPLFYPLTRLGGAYGLFVGQALFLLLAIWSVIRIAAVAPQPKRDLYWGTIAALILGPVAFWLWDNPVYGWHGDLLFLPLSILFCTTLINRSRWKWLAAGLMILTREEGAIVAWAVHVLHEFTVATSLSDTSSLGRRDFLRLTKITAGWLILFGAGIALLAARHASGEPSRLVGGLRAAAHLAFATNGRALLEIMLIDAAFLVGSGMLIHLAGISLRHLPMLLICLLVIMVPGAIGGATYGIAILSYGITWAPRFAAIWGVLITGCLFAITYSQNAVRPSHNVRRPVLSLVLVITVLAQIYVLKTRKHYDFVARFTWERHAMKRTLVSAAITKRENNFLRCLGSALPRDTEVASNGSLFARFHRQYIVWPDRVKIAWKFPQLVVCDDEKRLPWEYGCERLQQDPSVRSFRKVDIDGISVSYNLKQAPLVESCAYNVR